MATYQEKQQQLSAMLEEIQRLDASIPKEPEMSPTDKIISIFEDIGASGMKGVARTVGLPADIGNMILELGDKMDMSSKRMFQTKQGEAPTAVRIPAGTEEAQMLMGEVGLATEAEGKTDVGRYIGRGVEEATAAALPIGGILQQTKNVSLTAQPARNVIGQIMQQTAKHPGVVTSAEGGLGFTSGLGAEGGKDLFPDSPYGEVGGAITGAFAPTAGIGLVKRGMEYTPKARTEKKVRQIVQDSVKDVDKALTGLSDKGIEGIDTRSAQKSGDTGLLDLEASVVHHDEAFKGDYESALENIRQAAKDKFSTVLRGNETPEQMHAFVAERVARLDGLINRRIEQAMETAQKNIDQIDVPYASAIDEAEASSQIARDSLETAFKNARNQEASEWGKIDFTVKADTSPIRAATIKAKQDIGRLGGKDPELEKLFKDLIGKEAKPTKVSEVGMTKAEKLKARREAREVDKVESQTLMRDNEEIDELRKLRTRILDAKRRENGTMAPSRSVLGKLDDINDAILDVMESTVARTSTDSADGSQLRVAMDYTRKMHDRFTRGSVGKLLRYDSIGGERVPDIDTLRTLIRPGAIGAAKADDVIRSVDELINAVPAEELTGAIEKYLKAQFITASTARNGIVDPKAMDRFLKSHGPVLNRFPELKADLSDAQSAQRLADDIAKSGEQRIANIHDKNKSRAALYLDIGSEKPELVIDSIFKPGNPNQAKDMDGLIALARRDPTGSAFEGLKTATHDHMWNKVVHDMTIDGDFIVSTKMSQYIKDNHRGLVKIYGSGGVKRLNSLAKEIAKTERIGRAGAVEDVNKLTTLLVSSVGRITGVKIGPKFGVSPLVAAGIGRSLSLAMLKKPAIANVRALLMKSLQDPAVMRTMLMDAAKPQTAIRLRAHLIDIGVNPDDIEE